MDYVVISRILFALFLVNEAIVVVRSTPEQRALVALPRFAPLFFIMVLVPFFVALPLPAWIGLPVVIIQGAGLLLEVASEIQLSRAKSFAISAEAGTQPQTTGMYRYLENPIYTGITMQAFAWGVFMPLAFICFFLQVEACRKMVRNEREYLKKTLNFVHRGIDSFLWN